MIKFIKKAAAKVTKERVKWVIKVNVAGWLIQAAIAVTLITFGMETASALITAKVTNWGIFLGQMIKTARAA